MEQEEQIIRLKWKSITDFRKLFVRDRVQFVKDNFNFEAEIKKAKRGSRLGLTLAVIFAAFFTFELCGGATITQLFISGWMALLFLMMWMDGSNKLQNLGMLQLLENLSNRSNPPES